MKIAIGGDHGGFDLKEKIKNLTKDQDEEGSLSQEEVDEILSGAGYEEVKNEPPPRTRKRSAINLKEAYAKLGIPPTSSLEQVERAFKKEIRKYHPDRYATDPEKAKTATKVSQMLTEAYELITKSKQ